MFVSLFCLLGADLFFFPSCLSWSWPGSDLSCLDIVEDNLVWGWPGTGLVHGHVQVTISKMLGQHLNVCFLICENWMVLIEVEPNLIWTWVLDLRDWGK